MFQIKLRYISVWIILLWFDVCSNRLLGHQWWCIRGHGRRYQRYFGANGKIYWKYWIEISKEAYACCWFICRCGWMAYQFKLWDLRIFEERNSFWLLSLWHKSCLVNNVWFCLKNIGFELVYDLELLTAWVIDNLYSFDLRVITLSRLHPWQTTMFISWLSHFMKRFHQQRGRKFFFFSFLISIKVRHFIFNFGN